MRIAEPYISRSDIEAVVAAMEDNQISSRTPVREKFEKEFAKRMKSKYAISVNSGSSALFLSLKALGIGEGDEVIIPCFAYIAVANAVVQAGATPVFVDVEFDTFNIDPTKIFPTRKTKAIIAVHTYGHVCDMEKLLNFGIPIIEDAAEAHGALYKKKIAGSIGEVGCFSFFGNKIMTTGEGGMIITNNKELATELRGMRDQFLQPGYKHAKIGWSMCLSGLQCSLGRSQLAQLDEFLDIKRSMADLYGRLSEYIGSPVVKDYATHSWWMYAVKKNVELENFLHKNGIDTRPGFVPIHEQPPYKSFGAIYTVANSLDLMCLPMNVKEGNLEVVACIEQFFKIQ